MPETLEKDENLTEENTVLSAAEELVRRGILYREDDVRYAGFVLDGDSFAYTFSFWIGVGALVPFDGGPSYRCTIQSPEDEEALRARLAATWVEAGATPEWAREEADAAVAFFLVC